MENQQNIEQKKTIVYYGNTMQEVRNLEGEDLKKHLIKRFRYCVHLMRHLPDLENNEDPEDLDLACQSIGRTLYHIATVYIACDRSRYEAYCECTSFFRLPDNMRTRYIFIHDQTEAGKDLESVTRYIMQHQYVINVRRERKSADVMKMGDMANRFVAYVGDLIGITMEEMDKQRAQKKERKYRTQMALFNQAVMFYRNSVLILDSTGDTDTALSQLHASIDRYMKDITKYGNIYYPEENINYQGNGSIADRVSYLTSIDHFKDEEVLNAVEQLKPMYDENGVPVSQLQCTRDQVRSLQESMKILVQYSYRHIPENMLCYALNPDGNPVSEAQGDKQPVLTTEKEQEPEKTAVNEAEEKKPRFTGSEIILGVALAVSLILNVVQLLM